MIPIREKKVGHEDICPIKEISPYPNNGEAARLDPQSMPQVEKKLKEQLGKMIESCPDLKDRLHSILESEMSHETKAAEFEAAQWLIDTCRPIQGGSFVSQVKNQGHFVLGEKSFDLEVGGLILSLPNQNRSGNFLLSEKLHIGSALFRELEKPIFVHSSMRSFLGENPSFGTGQQLCLKAIFEAKGILGFYAQNFPIHLYRFLANCLLKGYFSIDGTRFYIPTLLPSTASMADILKLYFDLTAHNLDKHELIEFIMMHITGLPKQVLEDFQQELIKRLWIDKEGVFFLKNGTYRKITSCMMMMHALCAVSLKMPQKHQLALHQFLKSHEMRTILASYSAATTSTDIDEVFHNNSFALAHKHTVSNSIFEGLLHCYSKSKGLSSSSPAYLLHCLGEIKERDKTYFVQGEKIHFLYYPVENLAEKISEHLQQAIREFKMGVPSELQYLTDGVQMDRAGLAKKLLLEAEPGHSPVRNIDNIFSVYSDLMPIVLGELDDGTELVTKFNFGKMHMDFYRKVGNRLYSIGFSNFEKLKILSPD